MPEKTTLSISSTMDDEEMENSSNEKKISNLTKVGHMCMVCGFRATTKNKYRELQDHLVRQHFQDRIKSALPTRRPFMCPDEGCKVEGKDWQALMRHYTGKHGILEGYLKEVIASGQVSRAYRDNMKKPRISALNPVLDGYEDNRNKENNVKQASIPLSRGIRNRKRRKLRQPSSSGSTGSNSSISGVSRGSSGSDDLIPIHGNDQEMHMSTIHYKAEGNNNIIEAGKVSIVNGTTLYNQTFPTDVTQQLLQLQHPLPPVRWKQNSTDNLPETIEVDETNVAEKPTHLALVLKQKTPDQGFEIGRSENETTNNGLQYDEMYAFVDLKCFMPVSPNEYVIVPPKPTVPTSSSDLVNTADATGCVPSLSDDIDNFVAVPMPANSSSPGSLQSNPQNFLSHSQPLPQLSFSNQISTSIAPSIVSNNTGPIVYQNALGNINSIGNCNNLSQDHGIHIGSDIITSAPSSENLSSIITDVSNTDTISSLTTTYYTNQAGDLLTTATLPSHTDVLNGEGMMPGQTYIIPPSSTASSPVTLPNSLSTSTIPESFNISTATLQPQFAPMPRQIVARSTACNPQHGIIVPVSSNSRPGTGPILISTPTQQQIGVNLDYKPDIRNELLRSESFSRDGAQQSQLSQLPLVTLPARAASGQQIDLGQIVRQTITAPMSTISVESVEQLHNNISLTNATNNVTTIGQHIIPMDTDVDNHQVYSIPISSYPATCPSMSTATMEAAEAAVAAANNLNSLHPAPPTIIYRPSNTQDLPVSMPMPSLTKINTASNLDEQPITLQFCTSNSLSSNLPPVATQQTGKNEVSNMLGGCQNTVSFSSSSFESSTTSMASSSKSLSNINNENTILLQNRPMVMEVREVVPSSAGYDSKPTYKCISGSNEDTENDSGIENDCLSSISNNRVIVEEAKSIPIDDDQTMTIVQIENIDMVNSHDVEVASTITVESTGGNQEKKVTTESKCKSPTTRGNEVKQSCDVTQNESQTMANSTIKPNKTITNGGKEIEFTMF